MMPAFRAPVILGLLALLALVLGFGSWATFARLEGAVILPGQIVVRDSRQIIQHPDGGVVEEVLVDEGARVAAGDPLLRLAAPDLLSEQHILRTRLDDLDVRMVRLVAERDGATTIAFPDDLVSRAMGTPALEREIAGQQRLFDLRLATFTEGEGLLLLRIDQLSSQGEGLLAQELATLTQLDLVAAEQQAQATLFDQGLVAQAPLLDLARETARLQGQMAELAVAKAQTAGQITETRLRLAALRADRRETAAAELRDTAPIREELAERHRALSKRIQALVLRAPVAGVVLGLQGIRPGMVLRGAEPLFSLVPDDGALVVQARLRPQDVDAVHPGQSVELAVSAFADVALPRLKGHVTMISADALQDPAGGESYFAVELALAGDSPDRLEGHALVPGMRVEAYLATGGQTPMAYLLDPFTRYFRRALREG